MVKGLTRHCIAFLKIDQYLSRAKLKMSEHCVLNVSSGKPPPFSAVCTTNTMTTDLDMLSQRRLIDVAGWGELPELTDRIRDR
jgi:hypothetical protein